MSVVGPNNLICGVDNEGHSSKQNRKTALVTQEGKPRIASRGWSETVTTLRG